ncbi:MAG: copper homeostasis protein CutC [Bacteroidetes bacterium]|nr:copper homeostasis protein CutC [Bacteroidota bacterium]
MSALLEIAVFNIESAFAAANAGADRLELCENPYDGGTTPSYGFLKNVAENISIPVFPIIRPRGGDFLYSQAEFKQICYDIELCKDLGFKGVVSGLLLADGTIDHKRTSALVTLAGSMQFTFHRAFDRAVHPLQALETIIETGAHRILTSGQVPNAFDGKEMIQQLVLQSNDRIIIMPGSGVRSNNIKALQTFTGARELHSSARVSQKSLMQYHPHTMNEEIMNTLVDVSEIKTMKELLQ